MQVALVNMATANKMSQQELRQMMREKAQKKTGPRIESPLAKYDDKNNLWCVVCNVIVHSEALWTSHLIEKAHKKKIEELKQLKQKPANVDKRPQGKSSNGLKRSLAGDWNAKKASKFEKISEFSKKEILIKQSKAEKLEVEANEESDESQTETVTGIVDESLPQDFFDSNVQPAVIVNRSGVGKENNKKGASSSAEDNPKEGTLPKGFFDDPKQDSRTRNGPHAKDPFEEQMDLFRKEIAQESIVSDVILEEDIDQLQQEKTLTEVEEQIMKWGKVEEYQKKIDEIHKKRESEKAAVNKEESDSDEDDDPENFKDMNFWRSKGAFL